MFGFEPISAAYNVLEFARPMLIIAGVIAILAFLFKGQIMAAFATLFIAALLYFTYQPSILENIGANAAKMLTIETGVETDTPADNPPSEQPDAPESPPKTLLKH
jgi:hypothetical protein